MTADDKRRITELVLGPLIIGLLVTLAILASTDRLNRASIERYRASDATRTGALEAACAILRAVHSPEHVKACEPRR